MKNISNTLSIVTIAASILLAGCASAPTDQTTTIEEDEVTTAVLDASVEEKTLEPELTADTVFYFDFDKAILKDESKSALNEHASWLQNSPRNIRLEGHADERGTREYNMALGERRATAVKEFLVLQGVSAGLIEVVSYGEERAASYGSNDDSWALNRRVELK